MQDNQAACPGNAAERQQQACGDRPPKFHESNALAAISRSVRQSVLQQLGDQTAPQQQSVLCLGTAAVPEAALGTPERAKKAKRKRKVAIAEATPSREANALPRVEHEEAQRPDATAWPTAATNASELNAEADSPASESYLQTFMAAFGDDLEMFRGNSTDQSAPTELLLRCIEAQMQECTSLAKGGTQTMGCDKETRSGHSGRSLSECARQGAAGRLVAWL